MLENRLVGSAERSSRECRKAQADKDLDAPGRGAAWLARLNGVQKVASSNLVAPTQKPLRDSMLRKGFLFFNGTEIGRALCLENPAGE
jgi:hypothetical protein